MLVTSSRQATSPSTSTLDSRGGSTGAAEELLRFAIGESCGLVSGWVLVSRPLYQLKAEFFKTLGHPARIRVLELLSQREHAVAELLPEVGVEAANLSQQLAVLRRAGLVVARKEGATVFYSLTSPQVAELLAVARRILTTVLSGQVELLEDLRVASAAEPARRGRRRTGTG
jgi:ArsR family transcriptional regulator